MKSSRQILILICLLTLSAAWAPQNAITVQENSAEINFPETITFKLQASSSTKITSIHLEFGTDALSCGENVSRAIPEDYDPDTEIAVEWVWNLRRSGSVPPGTEVWWRWILENEAGEEIETPVQRLIFMDDIFDWRTVVSEHLSLNWYEGSEQFAASLLEAGEDALARLNQMTGVMVEKQVKVYIYASSEDMQEGTLFAPDWSGGMAFPWNSAVIIGVAPSNLAWGMDTMAHELAHVVIGHYTFSCVNSTPIWIDEGLAMVPEGDLELYFQGILQDAVDADTLLSVREVGQIFSADPDLARLSYAESFSLVTYLLETHGDEPILQLLDRFKQGESEDRALDAVYGFDRDGLEMLWRDWLGAAPMPEPLEQGATPTATLFPTLEPIVGPSIQASQTPVEIVVDATPEQNNLNQEAVSEEESQEANEVLNPVLLVGLGGGLLLGLAVVLFLRRRRESQGL
jgi:hypothetical protein